MSLKMAKEHLLKILGDEDYKVIALSGEWGIGKTTLWSELKLEAEDQKVKELFTFLFLDCPALIK
mgnify:CR=1 FL=1